MGSYGIFWNDSGMFCRLPQVPQGRGSGLWAKARQVLPVRLLSWFSERLLTIILRWCLTLLPACSCSVWALWFPWHPVGVCTLAQIRFFWAKPCATWKWLYSNATSEMQKRCFIPRAADFSKFCASSCGLHQSQWSQYTNTHTHSLRHTCNHLQSHCTATVLSILQRQLRGLELRGPRFHLQLSMDKPEKLRPYDLATRQCKSLSKFYRIAWRHKIGRQTSKIQKASVGF